MRIDTRGKWYILGYTKIDPRGMIMESTAKLFQNGRSQAIRLPKAFRFKGTEVKIRKEGEKVIIEPIQQNRWPNGFWDLFEPDPEFETPKPLPSETFDLD